MQYRVLPCADRLTKARVGKGIPFGPGYGWLTEMARCPAGNRRSWREPWAGSNPAPSASERVSELQANRRAFGRKGFDSLPGNARKEGVRLDEEHGC